MCVGLDYSTLPAGLAQLFIANMLQWEVATSTSQAQLSGVYATLLSPYFDCASISPGAVIGTTDMTGHTGCAGER